MAADIEEARNEAVSYAALNIILHRFYDGPAGIGSGRNQTRVPFASRCRTWAIVFINLSTVGDTPAALGNRIAQTVINHALADGANEANNYANPPGWEPVNETLIVELPARR